MPWANRSRLERGPWFATAAAFALLLVAPLACSFSANPRESASSSTRRAEEEPRSERRPVASAVYAAVIRRLVKDHSAGPPARRIYVVDGVTGRAARPLFDARRDPPVPFASVLREGIAEGLRDLAPVEFVRTRRSVLTRSGAVRGNAVLITLGAIRRNGKSARVGCNAYSSGKGALWLTYVLRGTAGTWRVTGTTGPMIIS